jgi:SAM-dependent methyltransferase
MKRQIDRVLRSARRAIFRVPARPLTVPQAYDTRFYAGVDERTRRSAHRCVPVLLELLGPSSVVDVGCGRGYWLEEFRALGVRDVLGLEGMHLSAEQTVLPAGQFRNQDLTLPFRLERDFDLALCLEVAEHLPARCAGRFVASLASMAPLVVFSAAIPGQGGVNHVNEQWPWYWQGLFKEQGFMRLDPFRKMFWGDPEVAEYYQQNLYIYVRLGYAPALVERLAALGGGGLTLVVERILRDAVR